MTFQDEESEDELWQAHGSLLREVSRYKILASKFRDQLLHENIISAYGKGWQSSK